MASIAGVIVLRAALWITASQDVAYFLVVRLMPLWVLLELSLAAGTLLCGYALAAGRETTLFGRAVSRSLLRPLFLLGVVTLLLEAALWIYGLGAR